jgi:ferritin
VDLGAVPSPKSSFSSPLEAVRAVRDWKRTPSQKISQLFDQARREKAFALKALLHWFIAEQVEEKRRSNGLWALSEQSHKRPRQLFMLDHSLE